jgi:hypothetical protein
MPKVGDRREHLDLSAFLVIAWYAYRNRGTLKISALIRTFVTDATLYFLVMVAAQIHIQVSMSLQLVQTISFLAPPHHHYRRILQGLAQELSRQ